MQSVLMDRKQDLPPVIMVNWTVMTRQEFLRSRESEALPAPKK